jgi:integrase
MSRPKGRQADRVRRYVAKDGSIKEYRYPAKAKAAPQQAPQSSASGDDIAGLIAAWQRSPEWQKLGERSKEKYVCYLRHLRSVDHVRVQDIKRQFLLELRDAIAGSRGDGAARGFIQTVSAVLTWARDRGIIEHNPILGGTKGLVRGSLRAWTAEEAETAMRDLPEHFRRAVVLALYSGQRRGDLCMMRWSQYDGQSIRLTQEKTGAAIVIPVHPRLKAELDAWSANRTAVTILTNGAGLPWSPSLQALRRIAGGARTHWAARGRSQHARSAQAGVCPAGRGRGEHARNRRDIGASDPGNGCPLYG